ncbi:hypothetical protein GCM10017786_56190 [Amycolatopsis deserti]|uniref:DUF4352 domain-containing protein n=1 Tax=Amycolatopsis deserti TaxID=185696 RepID=A0ABQ3JBG6_9PSEU|nr:hypothetical protein [Amycolatopsis deserti]GHF15199.1 hypothetical protein GCM10017786_56190 [Amycolatopsis deserti]
MRTPRHAMAALALVAVTACGAPAQVEGGSTSTGGDVAIQQAVPALRTLDFGGQFRFGDGVAVSVSAPKPFKPSESAYPRSDRAVAFEIIIRNDGDQPYRLSGLSVSATVGDVASKQVVDSTQGYSGIVDAGKDVQPGRDVRLNLAFTAPPEPAEMRLTLRPTATSPVIAVYCGPA